MKSKTYFSQTLRKLFTRFAAQGFVKT